MPRMTLRQARKLGIEKLFANGHVPDAQEKKARLKAATKEMQGRDKLIDRLSDAHGLPRPVHEYRFHPKRKWRLDLVYEGWLAVEIQGGTFTNGRHSRGPALRKEHEKLNEALLMGFAVLFCLPEDIDSGAIFETVKRGLGSHGEQH